MMLTCKASEDKFGQSLIQPSGGLWRASLGYRRVLLHFKDAFCGGP